MSLDLSRPGFARIGAWSTKLSPVRFAILKQIAAGEGSTVSHEAIEGAVYGGRAHDPGLLKVNICHLRKRLKGSGFTIGSHWGFGYYLKPE